MDGSGWVGKRKNKDGEGWEEKGKVVNEEKIERERGRVRGKEEYREGTGKGSRRGW